MAHHPSFTDGRADHTRVGSALESKSAVAMACNDAMSAVIGSKSWISAHTQF